ncbi:MAG TPA: hypothetical protein VI957_01645 [Candidatus Paceibacterota bacterium]
MRIRRKPIRITESQGHLPFRTKNAGFLSYANPLERRIFGILSGMFLLLSITYVYFLASSVGYVSVRGEIVQKTRILSGQTAILEAAYLARAVDMTESYAVSRGLSPAGKQEFVERAANLTLDR